MSDLGRMDEYLHYCYEALLYAVGDPDRPGRHHMVAHAARDLLRNARDQMKKAPPRVQVRNILTKGGWYYEESRHVSLSDRAKSDLEALVEVKVLQELAVYDVLRGLQLTNSDHFDAAIRSRFGQPNSELLKRMNLSQKFWQKNAHFDPASRVSWEEILEQVTELDGILSEIAQRTPVTTINEIDDLLQETNARAG